MIQITKHFTVEEFTCKNCDCEWNNPENLRYAINFEFINKLEELRNALGSSIIITGGVRCFKKHKQTYIDYYGDKWNEHITLSSEHMIDTETGFFSAADCFSLENVFKMAATAISLGFKNVGFYSQIREGKIVDIFAHLAHGKHTGYFRRIYV